LGQEQHHDVCRRHKSLDQYSQTGRSGTLQRDLDRLGEWSKTWLLTFNPEKCKVMHIGHDLPTVYTMEDGNKIIQLESTSVEKDLGVWVTRDLKPSEQCIQSTRNAQAVLGMVKRQFKEIDSLIERILGLCITLM